MLQARVPDKMQAEEQTNGMHESVRLCCLKANFKEKKEIEMLRNVRAALESVKQLAENIQKDLEGTKENYVAIDGKEIIMLAN